MGMFDRIRVDMKLPGYSEVTTDEFQTKDLECMLDDYVISDRGELYREIREYEPTGEIGPFGIPLMRVVDGSYRREYLTNLNETINFYSSPPLNEWRDYFAEFREGKVVRIWYT